MSPRKSSRQRTVTTKVQQQNDEKTNKAAPILKRRKLSASRKTISKFESSSELEAPSKSTLPEETKNNDRKIDPVEKLLSMTCANTDILHMDDNDQLPFSSSSASSSSPAYPNLSLNFNKLINDNLRSYYLKLRKSPMEIHNDNSSFSVLNKQPQQQMNCQEHSSSQGAMPQVPFFRNVNFNPSPSFGQTIDDYIYYDDDDEPLSTDSEHEEISSPIEPKMAVLPTQGKMSFRYRQNENINFSLSDFQAKSQNEPDDILRFMKKGSVISGKASEMIGTSNFLINDFFF